LFREKKMPRSLWHGTVSFGLIYVPVEMYAASKDGALSLHLGRGHRSDGGAQKQYRQARQNGGG
jgi:non-homologous end joining protein Ku